MPPPSPGLAALPPLPVHPAATRDSAVLPGAPPSASTRLGCTPSLFLPGPRTRRESPRPPHFRRSSAPGMPGPRRFLGAGTHRGLSARASPTPGSHLLCPRHLLARSAAPEQETPTLPMKVSSSRVPMGHCGQVSLSLHPFAPPASGCELEVSPPFLRPGRARGPPGVTVTLAKRTAPLHPTSLWWGLT